MPNSRPNIRLNLPANSSSRSQHDPGVERARGRSRAAANSEWLKPGMFIMKMPNRATPRSTSRAAMRSAAGSGASAFGGRFGVRHSRGRRYRKRRHADLSARQRQTGSQIDVRDRHRRQPAQARAGSPRPRSSGPSGKPSGAELERAKADATLLWLKVQEDAGLDDRRRRRAVAPALRARLPRPGRRHRLRAQGEDGHPRQPLRRDGAAGRRPAAPAAAACTRPRRASRARTPTGSSSSRCPAR